MADGDSGREWVDAHFRVACDQFLTQIEALTDLLESAVPHVRELDLPQQVFAAVDPVRAELGRQDSQDFVSLMSRHIEAQSSSEDLMADLFDAFIDRPQGPKLILAMHESLMRRPRLPILLNSLVTSAVSTFEAHLAQITALYYRMAPNALTAVSREKEKEFSLADLKSLGSLEDAVDLAIERRVDDLMFGSLENWRKFYLDKLKLDFADLSTDWPALQEVFLRRHAIVHNGGDASRRYVREARVEGVHVGDPLYSDEAYVQHALDAVLVLGYLLAVAAWKKFATSADMPMAQLHELSYRLLVRERWQAVERLCSYGLVNAASDAGAQIDRVNLWLARKATGGAGSIQAEVEAWDVTALSDRFKLARACLLGQHDEAFEILPRLLDAKEISPEGVLEWPLLEELREHIRFAELAPLLRSQHLEQDASLWMGKRSVVVHRDACKRRPSDARLVAIEMLSPGIHRPCASCRPHLDARSRS